VLYIKHKRLCFTKKRLTIHHEVEYLRQTLRYLGMWSNVVLSGWYLPHRKLKEKTKYKIVLLLPPFSLIRNFGKQNTRGNVSKISVNHTRYRQIGSKSTDHSPLAWHAEGQTSGCNWWISIQSVDSTQDWRNFLKRFCVCFVFQSRVSTKMVVKIRYPNAVVISFVNLDKLF